ncbi:Bifunctional protein GlmU [Candidatus Tiddalikarchaeum anstoanum]|nr:Bifunctional protein GlmU [Candidatus Tiddalikarchaeum anstoanum]
MKTIILAGGYGTRLQPLTMRTPKSILPLGDSNTIMKILALIDTVSADEIILSLNRNQEKVKEYLDSVGYKDKIKYVFEESEDDLDKLGAIGALLYVVKTFGADDYIVLGADNYFKGLNLKDMVSQHNKTKAEVTIAHYELDDITKVPSFGVGVINEDGKIVEFQEKPSVEKALSTLVSTFLYIINKKFLETELPKYVDDEIKAGRKPDNMGNLWEFFCKKLDIYAYTFKGFWGDVGKPVGYIDTNRRSLDDIKKDVDKTSKISETAKITGKVILSKGCEVAEDVVIIGPCFIGENVKIERGSIIGPYTTILHDSKIGPYNIINGSIIFENVTTKSDVKVNRAVVDGSTSISKNTKIEEYALVGFGCELNEDSQILYESKIWPFLIIERDSVINSKIFYHDNLKGWKATLNNSKYWQ